MGFPLINVWKLQRESFRGSAVFQGLFHAQRRAEEMPHCKASWPTAGSCQELDISVRRSNSCDTEGSCSQVPVEDKLPSIVQAGISCSKNVKSVLRFVELVLRSNIFRRPACHAAADVNGLTIFRTGDAWLLPMAWWSEECRHRALEISSPIVSLRRRPSHRGFTPVRETLWPDFLRYPARVLASLQ